MAPDPQRTAACFSWASVTLWLYGIAFTALALLVMIDGEAIGFAPSPLKTVVGLVAAGSLAGLGAALLAASRSLVEVPRWPLGISGVSTLVAAAATVYGHVQGFDPLLADFVTPIGFAIALLIAIAMILSWVTMRALARARSADDVHDRVATRVKWGVSTMTASIVLRHVTIFPGHQRSLSVELVAIAITRLIAVGLVALAMSSIAKLMRGPLLPSARTVRSPPA